MSEQKQEIKKIKKIKKINELFIEGLKNKGYILEEYSINEYIIKGNNIYGFISFNIPELSKNNYWTNGMIIIDHKNCFNKTSRCPCKLKIPKTNAKIKYIIEQLKYWGSDEGLKESNNYESEKWIDEYLNKPAIE